MHKIAYYIASYSSEKGWIDDDDIEMCCYSFEHRFLEGLFFLIQLLIYAPSGKIKESFICITVLLVFRRRMGGVHASSAWFCLIISTMSVLISVFVFGPLVRKLPMKFTLVFDFVLVLSSFFLKPSYPSQVHFAQQDVEANIHRIHLVLVALIAAQIASIFLFDVVFLIYSFIGLLLADFTVILGHLNNRKEYLL